MDEKQLIALVDEEFTSAMGAPQGDISTERANAWNYYLSKPLGNEEEGQSQVVTSDVADVVDGIIPSLLRIFTTSDNLVQFDPVGPEDEDQAAQESDYVNHVFFKGNDAFEVLYTWMFDALVSKNGVVKAWWDDSEEVTSETYRGLTVEEVVRLLEDPELEPVERAEREPGPEEVPGSDGLIHDIEFRRVRKTGKVCVDNVAPEEYRVSADARKLSLDKVRMVGHEREVPRSELIDMGYPQSVVDDLPAHMKNTGSRGNRGSEEEQARYDREDERYDSAREHSMDLILVREAYIRVDFDGDGRAELRRVVTAGNVVLENEPADRQPFHVISPQPLPHKHFGRATAEKVMDVQQVSTTLVRQVLDNLYHTNNPSHAVWDQGIGENTLDDLLTRRVGSINRFARPPRDSYAPMTVPFTASATFPMVEYWDKVKRDRTGIGSDAEGLSPDAMKHVQQSVMSSSVDLSKMKVEAVARIFAETGFRSLFLHIRELLAKNVQKADVIKLRGRWVPVDPRRWKDRRDTTISIGLGIGTRDSNLMHLQAIGQLQQTIAAAGGMNLVVTPQNVYAMAREVVKNANYKTPEMFFTDPGDQLAPPPTEEQEALQQQQQQIIQRQQQLDAQDQAIKQAKVELDRQRTLFETDQKLKDFAHKREMDLAELMLESRKVRQDIESAQNADDIAQGRLALDRFLAAVDTKLKTASEASE